MSDTKVLTPDGTQHLIDKIKSEKESTFRFSTMPTPSVDYADGKPYQYIGATTSVAPIYTNGYFYKCVAQGTDPETYAWERTNVQPTSEGDERIKPEITEIGVKFDDGLRPYIKVDIATIIPSFADATWDDIAMISDLYYSGDLSLEDIRNVWSVGDSKNIVVSAMPATGVGETHAEQTVTVKLVDFNHDNLVTEEGEKTKALLTLGFVLAENGYYHPTYNNAKWGTTDNSEGWKNSARRTWCNSVCFDALPNGIKEVLKPVNKTMNNERDGGTYTVADKIFLPTINEFIGKNATASDVSNSSTSLKATLTGTRYALYLSQPTHSKALYSSSNIYHSYTDWSHIEQQYVTADGGARCCWQTELRGIAPHFCI